MKKKQFVTIVTIILIIFLGVYSDARDNSSSSQSWTLKSVEEVDDNPMLVHMIWETYRPPYGPLDRIALHRVVKKNKMFSTKKVTFIIPGTWNAGGWSEITDPDINFYLYLANNGYDVYTMDFRLCNLPDIGEDQFTEYGIDISPTADWTYAVFREDIKACVEEIKDLTRVKRIFLGGFSRGGVLMFIYANKYQEDLRGLICLDSNIKDIPPTGIPLDEATYNMIINLFKAGQLVDPDSGQLVPWIVGVYFLDPLDWENWRLAGALPYSKHLVGGPLPGDFDVISDYVADNAHYVWAPMLGEGSLANYHGGYIDRDILVKVINEFYRFYPNVQSLEDIQMYAHDDVPYFDYDDNDVDLPMIAFQTFVGCPGYICMIDAIPNLTISDDVTVIYLQGYGHMDVLFGKDSLTDVKQPLLNWLDDHISPGNSPGLSWQSSDHQFVDSLLESLIKPLFQIKEN